MDKSIERFKEVLTSKSDDLKRKLILLSKRFSESNQKNLSEKEQRVNVIHFFRSIGNLSTDVVFYHFKNEEEVEVIESEFLLQNKYLLEDHIEIEAFLEDELEEDLLERFFNKCEVEYILWFAKLWFEAGCYTNKKIQYALVENNSVRTFYLSQMNWEQNLKDPILNSYKYFDDSIKFDDVEIKKRIQTGYKNK